MALLRVEMVGDDSWWERSDRSAPSSEGDSQAVDRIDLQVALFFDCKVVEQEQRKGSFDRE